MAADLTGYKVGSGELSSSTKFDNLVQAVQDALNAIGDTTKMGFAAAGMPIANLANYPADAAKYLRGDGTWATPSGITVYKANYDIVSNASEANLISQSIPGNTLGVNGALLITAQGVFLKNASNTWTPRVKFGGTTLWGDAGPTGTPANSATNRPFYWSMLLANTGATNSQRVTGLIFVGDTFAPTVAGIGNLQAGIVPFQYGGTSAADTTSAQTLAITWQWGTSSASLELKGTISVAVLT